jgi:hypothetical protein
MGVLAAVALATALFSETAGQSENRVPIDTTICELRTSPQRFDGEMVQFKANYRVPFIDGPAAFFDSCPAETPRIRIELAEWTERLENDPELREALTQCHVINAAFLGRFDVVPKQNEEANPNTLHLTIRMASRILIGGSGLTCRGPSGKLVILRFTPRGFRRLRLDATRFWSISSRTEL